MSWIDVDNLEPVVVLREVSLFLPKVAQSLTVDSITGEYFVSQVSNASNGDIAISRLSKNGTLKSHMLLKGFGHGTSIDIEREGDNIFLWVEADSIQDSTGTGYGRKIARVRYIDNGEVSSNQSDLYDILPNRTNLSVSIDKSNDMLVTRSRFNGKSYYNGYKLSKVKKREFTPEFEFISPIGGSQGHSICERCVYLWDGAGASGVGTSTDHMIYCFTQNGVMVYGRNLNLSSNLYYKEPEGIKVLSNNGQFNMYLGMATGAEGSRKYMVYRYSKDVNKFIELTERVSVSNVKDGVTLYSHTAWATDDKGANFSLEYDNTKTYRGILENSPNPNPSLNPQAYTWSRWTGTDGDSVHLKGELNRVEDLPQKGQIGDTYFIQGYMWAWNGKQWQNMGKIQGENGKNGVDGASCVIFSTGGTIFKNGEGSTTLTAKIYRGETEIDTGGTQYQYVWEKWTEGVKDNWSAKGKSIDVDYNHVNVSTTFIVKIDRLIQGQITITDLNDTIVSLKEPTQKIEGTLWHNLNDNKTYVWTGQKWELVTPTVIVGANNKILNSNFMRGYNNWVNTTYVIDNDLKYNNNPSIQVNVEGASTDVNTKLKSEQSSCIAEIPISAQCKSYIPSGITNQSAFTFSVVFFNINKTEISRKTKNIDINLKDKWQHIKIENIKSPANTMYVGVEFNLVRNGKVNTTEIQVESSTTCSDYRVAAEDLLDYSNEIFNEVISINEKIEDDAIIRTVVGSTELSEKFGEKANIEDLEGLITNEKLNNATSDLKSYIDKTIGGLNLTSYVQKTELQQTMQDFLFNFTQGGGVNLLLNSLGLASNYLGWDRVNSVTPIENGDINRLGFSSGWHFNSTSATNSIRQTVSLNANKEYTISFFIRKNAGVRFQVEFYNGVDTTAPRKDFVVNKSTNYNYDYIYFTFKPTSQFATLVFVNHGTDGGSNVIITGLMLNQGAVPFTWQPHPTEMYNDNTKIDRNGITVNRLEGTEVVGYTAMTPHQFAGYYRNVDTGKLERIFALSEDYTLTKKLVARDEINIGTLKMVKVSNSKHTGVAFVALGKEFEVE